VEVKDTEKDVLLAVRLCGAGGKGERVKSRCCGRRCGMAGVEVDVEDVVVGADDDDVTVSVDVVFAVICVDNVGSVGIIDVVVVLFCASGAIAAAAAAYDMLECLDDCNFLLKQVAGAKGNGKERAQNCASNGEGMGKNAL
jgi:hypothetical protein